jgi:hypothetical protein
VLIKPRKKSFPKQMQLKWGVKEVNKHLEKDATVVKTPAKSSKLQAFTFERFQITA